MSGGNICTVFGLNEASGLIKSFKYEAWHKIMKKKLVEAFINQTTVCTQNLLNNIFN